MENKNKIEITTCNGVTKILLNGEEVKGVRKVSFSHEVNKSPTVTLEIYAKAAVIDSPAVIDMKNAFENNNRMEVNNQDNSIPLSVLINKENFSKEVMKFINDSIEKKDIIPINI